MQRRSEKSARGEEERRRRINPIIFPLVVPIRSSLSSRNFLLLLLLPPYRMMIGILHA